MVDTKAEAEGGGDQTVACETQAGRLPSSVAQLAKHKLHISCNRDTHDL